MAVCLAYARIEIYRSGSRIGVAEYDARSGGMNFGKVVKGETKIRKLVDKLFPDTAPTTAPVAHESGVPGRFPNLLACKWKYSYVWIAYVDSGGCPRPAGFRRNTG